MLLPGGPAPEHRRNPVGYIQGERNLYEVTATRMTAEGPESDSELVRSTLDGMRFFE